MSSLLQAAARPEDLVRVADPRLPYRFDRIFAGEGMRQRRLAKRRLELLQRLEGELARMLETGETVELVSWGIEYSFVEAYFMGLWHYQVNRRALVLTDRRILMLQVDARRRLRDLKFAVPYAAIRSFAKGTLGYLGLVLRDGRKLYVTGIPGPDRKAIRAFVQARLERSNGAAAPAAGRQNLCPHCYQPVAGLPERCPRCQGGFKSGARAGWLSLLMPGLGDLYLGHRAFGALELIGALAVWGIVLSSALGARADAGGDGAGLAGLAAAAGFVFVAVHGTDAWITRRTGRKGIYPAR